MAIRNIRQEGDEILKKKSREVEVIDDKVKELIEDMVETMHKYDGVGLAAVQVGILKRMFIIYDGNEALKVVNPEILSQSGKNKITQAMSTRFTKNLTISQSPPVSLISGIPLSHTAQNDFRSKEYLTGGLPGADPRIRYNRK